MTIEEMRARKAELGYTNEMISALSGVPLGTVQKVFAGSTGHPRHKTLLALEKAFAPSYNYMRDDIVQSSVIRERPAPYRSESHSVHTVEDYYALPDERRAELIDGVFYDMSSPSSIHQLLSMEISRTLANFIRAKGGSCVPFYSPIDVQLDRDDYTVIQPDVIVVCDRNKITQKGIYGAPDLVIEILSPSTKKKDMYLKLSKYKKAGVREYWLVDPEKKQVVVYSFENNDNISIYNFSSAVPVGIFNGECRVDFADIYEYVSFLYAP